MKHIARQYVSLLIILFVSVTFLFLADRSIFAQTETPTSSPTPSSNPTPTSTPIPTPDTSSQQTDLVNQINDLKKKISDSQNQEKTLSSQISVMDNQIKLTELRIRATKQDLQGLASDIETANKKISTLENSLDNLTKVLINRIVATYQTGSINHLYVLLSSDKASDFFTRESYLKLVQERDKKLIYETQQAKNDYTNQKQIFEDKRKKVEALRQQLQVYTDDLNNKKAAEKRLLAETQGSEANYQRILAQTEAQLAAFSKFTTSQGGASLLNNQTSCDEWGCYYNQRDSKWGSTALNNTQYTIASDGCLVTAMAMIYTHYGYKNVDPQSINSVSGNFSGIPAALLRKSIVANGVSSQRLSADIDSTLAGGNPVIIGISYDGGSWPDHFVVFVSGSNGDYKMNDPFTPNGRNISFKERYPGVKIVEVDRVVL